LNQTVSHFASQLADAAHGERVRVAGMVTRIRQHQTKAGQQMAFATLEDIQGNIELIIFPRTWEKVQTLLSIEQIVVVDGKVDNPDGSEPKVLVDTISTELKVTAPLANEAAPIERGAAQSQTKPSRAATPPPTPSPRTAPTRLVQETQPVYVAPTPPAAKALADTPPPPENFPDEWISYAEMAPGGFVTETVRTARPTPSPMPIGDEPDEPDEAEPPESVAPAKPTPLALTALLPAADQPAERPPLTAPPTAVSSYLVSPSLPVDFSEAIHMITVVMRTCGDKVRDNLRLRQAYGTLISYPGNDKFAFQVFEGGRGYLIEFPNFTTGLCAELLTRLQEIVGNDNVRVEPITIL